MKIICWACIWVYFDLQWKHFKRITSILLCDFLLKIMIFADLPKRSGWKWKERKAVDFGQFSNFLKLLTVLFMICSLCCLKSLSGFLFWKRGIRTECDSSSFSKQWYLHLYCHGSLILMVHLPYVSTIHRHQHLYWLRLRLLDSFCFALSRRQEEVLWRIYCEPERQEEAASVQSSVQRSNIGNKTSWVVDSKFLLSQKNALYWESQEEVLQ